MDNWTFGQVYIRQKWIHQWSGWEAKALRIGGDVWLAPITILNGISSEADLVISHVVYSAFKVIWFILSREPMQIQDVENRKYFTKIPFVQSCVNNKQWFTISRNVISQFQRMYDLDSLYNALMPLCMQLNWAYTIVSRCLMSTGLQKKAIWQIVAHFWALQESMIYKDSWVCRSYIDISKIIASKNTAITLSRYAMHSKIYYAFGVHDLKYHQAFAILKGHKISVHSCKACQYCWLHADRLTAIRLYTEWASIERAMHEPLRDTKLPDSFLGLSEAEDFLKRRASSKSSRAQKDL